MPQHRQHRIAAILFHGQFGEKDRAEPGKERGGEVRGLGRIRLLHCRQGYGVAKGTVYVCGCFTEAL